MSKAILLSIKPKYVADILNGKKTIEIRKTMPKCDLPIDVYIYCTKDKKHLVAPFHFIEGWKYKEYNDNTHYAGGWTSNMGNDINGKVVAKFTVRKVEAIDIWQEDLEEKMKPACLSIKEFDDYSKGQVAYAYYIEDLVIFDEPKELSEFVHKVVIEHHTKGHIGYLVEERFEPLTKAPQNFCYVEAEE